MGDTKRKTRASEGGEKGGGPPAKRHRVSRACDQCRAAREKCDGIQPICFTCASSNRDCSYTANPKRRGIQPGYIRTLELALAWTLINVPNSEESLKGLLSDEKGQLMLSGHDNDASNKLHRKWRKNAVCKAIDRLLSGLTADEAFVDRSTSPPDEEEDDEDHPIPPVAEHSMLTPESQHVAGHRDRFDPNNGTKLPRLPIQAGQSDQITFHQSDPFVGQPLQVHNYILPETFWRLLDVHFAYAHSWLPVVEKESILKLCYSYPQEGLNLHSSTAGSGDHAELWSVLAIASFQDATSGGAATNMAVTESSQRTPSQLYNMAKYLIPDDQSKFELGHVSALLVLALINIGSNDLSSAWTVLGRAIRTISLLGLPWSTNGEPSTLEGVTQQLKKAKSIFLGCFILETFLSVRLEKMPHLRRDQALQVGLLEEEGLDEWQPWTACEGFQDATSGTNATGKRSHAPMLAKSTFNQLVRLSYVLNDNAVCRALQSESIEGEAALLDWIKDFPRSLGPLHSLQVKDSTPQKLNLFLGYQLARAICSPRSRMNAVEEALGVLDHYNRTFGPGGMPPLFSLFVSILQCYPDTDGLKRHRLAGVKSQLAKIWQPQTLPVDNPLSATMSTYTPQAQATPQGTTEQNEREGQGEQEQSSISTVYAVPDMTQESSRLRAFSNATPNFEVFVDPQNEPQFDLPAVPQSVYDSNYLERYNSSGSMDLDALFDDLASFDGTEPGSQPQFMQNLGFAPNANLADLMTSEFGWNYNPT